MKHMKKRKKIVLLTVALLLLVLFAAAAVLQVVSPPIAVGCTYTLDTLETGELSRYGLEPQDTAERYRLLYIDIEIRNPTVFRQTWSSFRIDMSEEDLSRIVQYPDALCPYHINRLARGIVQLRMLIQVNGLSEPEIDAWIKRMVLTTTNNEKSLTSGWNRYVKPLVIEMADAE